MPIVNAKDPGVLQPAVPVRISSPDYAGIAVDTRYIPSSELIAYLGGSAWTVEYYSQILDTGSELTGQSPNLNPVFQQYQLVSGFELKVTTPLATTQDLENNAMTVTGVANVYPMLIPSVGDMFIATIADGQSAVFKVTNVERKSLFKDTAHVIEYTLIDYLTDVRKTDLASKVVKTVKFVRDFLINGQNPLLVESDYLAQDNLKLVYKRIVSRYFKAFVSKEFKALIIPNQTTSCYDPFLTKAVLAVFNTFEAEQIRQIKLLTCQEDDYLSSISIWDVLLNQDLSLLPYTFKKAGVTPTTTFNYDAMLETIRWSGVKYLVYPADAAASTDFSLLGISPRLLGPYSVIDPNYTASITDAPPIAGTPFYVFSEAFYTQQNGQTTLEIQVSNFLQKKKLDLTVINQLALNCGNWTPVQQFYHIPVLLMLIKYGLGGI